MSAKVEDRGALVRRYVGTLRDRHDHSAFDHNVLIVNRRRSGAIDNPHVREHSLARVDTDEFLHRL